MFYTERCSIRILQPKLIKITPATISSHLVDKFFKIRQILKPIKEQIKVVNPINEAENQIGVFTKYNIEPLTKASIEVATPIIKSILSDNLESNLFLQSQPLKASLITLSPNTKTQKMLSNDRQLLFVCIYC